MSLSVDFVKGEWKMKNRALLTAQYDIAPA